MKTLGTRKRERQAAEAAAEQAQQVQSSVQANQMRKPMCRNIRLRLKSVYMSFLWCFTDQPYKPTALDLEQMYRATRVFTINQSSVVNEKDANMPPPSYEEAIVKLQERSQRSAEVITARA